MSYTFAQASVIGNIGRDPEMRYTPNGNSVTRFSIAVQHGRKVGDQWENETDWYNIVVWGKLGEFCNDKLRKGQKVHASGVLRNRKYTTADGTTKYACEIIARDITVLTPNSSGYSEPTLEGDVRAAEPTAQQMADATDVSEPDW